MAKKDIVKVSLDINRGYIDPSGIDKFPQDRFVLNYRCDNPSDGFNKNNVMAIRYSDGAISFSDYYNVEDFVYLYPQQIKHLKRILAMRPPNKFRGTNKQRKFTETARQAE